MKLLFALVYPLYNSPAVGYVSLTVERSKLNKPFLSPDNKFYIALKDSEDEV